MEAIQGVLSFYYETSLPTQERKDMRCRCQSGKIQAYLCFSGSAGLVRLRFKALWFEIGLFLKSGVYDLGPCVGEH